MIPYAVPLNGKAAAVAPQPLAVWNFKDGPTPNMTNSGGANGTCFGPDGLLTHVGTTNLLLHSEDFTNVVWGFSGVDFTTANYGNDPIGGATADRVVTDGFSGDYLYQDYAPGGVLPQVPFTFSCWVRGRTGNARLTINESGGATGARTVADGEAFDLDGGIRRYSVTITPNAADRTTLQVRFQSFSATVVDIDVWGAQLEQNVPSNGQGVYTPTTTAAATSGGLRFDHDPGALITNLCLQSEDFSTTWTTIRSSISTNSTTAPDGTSTADTLVEDNTASNSHYVQQTITPDGSNAYTFSVFAKAKERTQIRLFISTNGFPNNVFAYYNLSTGVVISTGGGEDSTSITDVGDGWYRCSITATSDAASATNWLCELASGGTNSYNGDNASGAYIWGAQVVRGSAPGSYVKTTTAAARGGPAPARGLLMEETRTNVCLQSEDFDTTWTKSDAAVTTNSTVAPDGTATADTITDDAAGGIEFIKQDITVANDTTTYAYSIFVKKTTSATVWPGFGLVFSGGATARRSEFHLNTNTGVLYARTGIAGQTDAGKGVVDCGDYWRIYILCQNTGDGHTTLTAYVLPAVTTTSADTSWSPNNTGSAICWGAQVEAGAFPTSYIKTTTASVARTADVVTVATSAIPGFSATEGTMLAEVHLPFESTNTIVRSAWTLHDTTLDEVIRLYPQSTAGAKTRSFIKDGGVHQIGGSGLGNGSDWADDDTRKISLAWKLNDVAIAEDGAIIGTDSSATLPTVTTLNIGSSEGNANSLIGHISRLAYWPERLSNDVLQGLTK